MTLNVIPDGCNRKKHAFLLHSQTLNQIMHISYTIIIFIYSRIQQQCILTLLTSFCVFFRTEPIFVLRFWIIFMYYWIPAFHSIFHEPTYFYFYFQFANRDHGFREKLWKFFFRGRRLTLQTLMDKTDILTSWLSKFWFMSHYKRKIFVLLFAFDYRLSSLRNENTNHFFHNLPKITI